MHCCLDACGNPLVDGCGNPFLDTCGNPASDDAGTLCTQSNVGMNMCPATECADNEECEMECVDSCGNALAVDISGKTA
eukprot:3613939-Rhodomonas_salina.1